MILDDLADYLQSLGIATIGANLFMGDQRPDQPDELLMLRVFGGLESMRVMGQALGTSTLDMPRVQIESRSGSYLGADTLLRSAMNALDMMQGLTINNTRYHHIRALQSDPLPLEVDANQRHSLVMNFEIMKGR